MEAKVKSIKKYGNEFKVGLFIILCILGAVYLIARTGKLNIKKDGYHIYVLFDEVAGLGEKAPVNLNGLEVGKVDDIKVSYDNDRTQILLKLWLDKEAKIREGAVASIKTLGLMGEKYIQISSSEGKDFIKPGVTLQGKPYEDLDSLMEESKIIAKNVDNLIGNLNGLTDEVKKLTLNLNYTVEDNQDTISEIVRNLETVSKNFEEFSEDLKRHPWKLLFREKEKKSREKGR